MNSPTFDKGSAAVQGGDSGAYPPSGGFPDPQDGTPCACGLRRLGRAVYEVEHLRDPARVCHRRDACATAASGEQEQVDGDEWGFGNTPESDRRNR